MQDEPTTVETPTEPTPAPVEAPVEPEKPVEPEAIPVNPPETMKVSWNAADPDPIVTGRPIKTIRVHSNVTGLQLRVMKTADAEDCLHIFVDV